MLHRNVVVFGCAACAGMGVLFPRAAKAGPDWVEHGDAGSLFDNMQIPQRPPGVMTLDSISGSLVDGVLDPDFEDLYAIRITDPATYSITLGFADFNASLYLFNITVNHELYGLLGNDDSGETNIPLLTNMADDGTGVIITQPGDYVLAVTGHGRVPVSRTGPIFSLGSLTELSGPDGPGGLNPLSGWTGTGDRGHYRVVLQSADFPTIPAPGAGSLMIVGMAALARRRR